MSMSQKVNKDIGWGEMRYFNAETRKNEGSGMTICASSVESSSSSSVEDVASQLCDFEAFLTVSVLLMFVDTFAMSISDSDSPSTTLVVVEIFWPVKKQQIYIISIKARQQSN